VPPRAEAFGKAEILVLAISHLQLNYAAVVFQLDVAQAAFKLDEVVGRRRARRCIGEPNGGKADPEALHLGRPETDNVACCGASVEDAADAKGDDGAGGNSGEHHIDRRRLVSLLGRAHLHIAGCADVEAEEAHHDAIARRDSLGVDGNE